MAPLSFASLGRSFSLRSICCSIARSAAAVSSAAMAKRSFLILAVADIRRSSVGDCYSGKADWVTVRFHKVEWAFGWSSIHYRPSENLGKCLGPRLNRPGTLDCCCEGLQPPLFEGLNGGGMNVA